MNRDKGIWTKAYHGIMKTLRVIDTMILIAIVLLVTVQVFFRFILQSPLGWTEQIARLLFLWGIMLGIPVVFYEKNDLVFDVLLHKFSPRVQRILGCAFALIGMAFSVFYLLASMNLCIKTGNRMTTGIIMPVNVLYGAQPVCAFMLLLIFTERLIAQIKTKA